MTEKEYLIYEKALAYAIKKHNGQTRIGGMPYITHPLAVREIINEKGYGLKYQIVALFHDLLEDTDATEEEIEEIGGKEVLKSVKILTKVKPYVMAEYMDGIKKNPMARAVKAADRLHNLRSAITTNDDFKRRYILESIDWFLDFDKDIPVAVKRLAESMDTRLAELSFLYDPIENWEINKKRKKNKK